MQQLRNTGILHADLLCVSVPINIIVCGKHVLKCILSLIFIYPRVRAELIPYRCAFVRNLDKHVSIPISHRVHVQVNIQNDKKYVNLYANASALSTQSSRLLPNWQQRLSCYKVWVPLQKGTTSFCQLKKWSGTCAEFAKFICSKCHSRKKKDWLKNPEIILNSVFIL